MRHPIIFVLITLVISAVNLYSCTCRGASTVAGSLKGSDLVVVGTVISAEEFRTLDSSDTPSRYFAYPRMRYTVVVIEKFKGNYLNDTITIITGMGGGDCGYRFGVGFEYVIYGHRQYADRTTDRPVDVFETNICTRTVSSADTKEIQELRALVGKKD